MSVEKPVEAEFALRRSDFRVGLLVLVVTTLYQLTWWNRYLSPATGFELMYASEYSRGFLPYRDYYLSVPPGMMIAGVGGVQLFGRHLIGYWALGVLARAVAVYCTYRLCVRVAPPRWAGWVTTVGFIASVGDVADFPPWYNYFTAILAVYATFTAVMCVESTGRAHLIYASWTGFWLAAGVVTKQTSGIMVGLTVLVALPLAVYWRSGLRRAMIDGLVLTATMAGLTLGLVAWLVANSAWEPFLDQVFLHGPASKGGAGGILQRYADFRDFFSRAAVLLLILLILAVQNRGARHPLSLREGSLAAGVGLGLGILLLFSPLDAYQRSPLLLGCAASLIGSCALAVGAAAAAFHGHRDETTLTLGLAAGTGFASCAALSMSWPVFEPMIWPSLAVIAAAAVGLPRGRPSALAQALVVSFGVVLLVTAGWRKFETPYAWGRWEEPPVWNATVEPELPELRGFRLSPQTAEFYDRVTRSIRAHSGPDDPILVFPHMALLYGLADRPVATFAYMHWADVCPDYVAEADVERLRTRPPAVIVWLDGGEDEVEILEQQFRSGRPSGQRILVSAMNELVRKEYQLVDVWQKSGEPPVKVNVWARRPRP